MVTVVSASLNHKAGNQNSARPPLLPSENENNLGHRRRKSRDVTSRYLTTYSSSSSISTSSSSSRSSSSSTSSSECWKRCPSPLVSRTNRPATPSAIQRSQSVGRRRPATPGLVTPRPDSLALRGTPRTESVASRAKGEVTAAQKMLVSSARNLSVSFQGDSFSTQASKRKPTPSPGIVRRGTPERRNTTAPVVATPATGADLRQNSKRLEKHHWPRSRQPSSISRSVDYTDERTKLSRSGNNVIRAPQNSTCGNRASCDRRPNVEEEKDDSVTNSISVVGSDAVMSDAESVSSGNSVSGAEEGKGKAQRKATHGIIVPARFWQETNSRVQRLHEPGSPISRTGSINIVPSKLITVPKKFGSHSPDSSPKGVVNNRGQLSPIRRPVRPASPGRLATPSVSSPLRGMSPSRMRNTVVASANSSFCDMPSILNFAADVRRAKIGENRVVDAHLLRLLYNKLLQWRFANARREYVLSTQRLNAERSLYNAQVSISRLCDSVRAKRMELQFLKQTLKLITILQGQDISSLANLLHVKDWTPLYYYHLLNISIRHLGKGKTIYLEEWASMDQDYSSCFSGAIEALRASTLRLPVVSGAMANIQSVKDAICSAVDVMQAMASSVCLLLPKTGEVSCISAELASVSVKECAMLEQCKDVLSTIAAMQTTECSLRAHILQQGR